MKKKLLVLLMVLALTLSMSVNAMAASDKSKDNGKDSKTSTVQAEKTNLQKQFKMEMNEQKRELAKSCGDLEEQKLQLEAQYQELLATDPVAAEALLASISDLDAQITANQVQMKQIINERYMVIKTMYSEEELQQFDSASALIEQMYADAEALGAGSVIVKDNLIKFEAPPYIKGGKTLVPVRTISEELGAEVSYDPDTQSVTVTKDGMVVVLTINSSTATVDGTPVEIGASADITCGRTYVPLRFLAETFGLEVNWDEENQEIDIEEGTSDGTGDGTIDGTSDGTSDGASDGTSDGASDGTTDGTSDGTTEE